MSYLRFNHVYMGLIVLSGASAFLIPPQYTSRFQPQFQMAFAPVSRPVGSMAAWISHRVSPESSDDKRAASDIRQENAQLRAEVAMLRTQLDEQARRDQELGPLKDSCRLVKVIGSDGTHESILLSTSTLQGITSEMYVLCKEGLVGQITRAGMGGAQVRLISDLGFRVRVRFARFENVRGHAEPELLNVPIGVAEGAGRGTLVIDGLTLAEIGLDNSAKPLPDRTDQLRPGDYVQVWDRECPRRIQGFVVGRVLSIQPRLGASLYAQIVVAPNTNLKRLREVMVMVKE